MSVLALRVVAGVLALLALIALRGKRWAYLAFVALGLAYYPAQAHFKVHVLKCQQVIPTLNVVVLSLHNHALIALFAGFCWMSWVQFRRSSVGAFFATLVAGVLIEITQGMTGGGICRVRDLVPVAAGALAAAFVLAIWSRLTRKPGYVRVGRPQQKAPSRKPAIPPRPAEPLRGIPTIPTAPPPRVVPPPVNLSPTPAASSAEPTQEVARSHPSPKRPEIVQRLQAMLQSLLSMAQRLAPGLWNIIRSRRRELIGGVVVLVVLAGAAMGILLFLPTPAATVAEQPNAPPPPPPRPLQSWAEGYYEPTYNFSVADRRFTRLTLRPDAFLTFTRPGTRQEVGCADARVGIDAVYLGCEFDRVGVVTIDGRFNSRYATNRLDAGVLTASITVTNTRGEVIYRGRDTFRWHQPD